MSDPPTAIVLAAGLSRRAAPHHKLLLPAPDGSGRAVVRATVEAMCEAAGRGEVIVVTGHAREAVEAALEGLPVRAVFAADFALGLGHSLAAGVRACALDTPGYLVTPGDLPGLTPALVARVLAAAAIRAHRRHVVPTAEGRRGHPVFLGAWLRESLSGLTGDAGARGLLQSEPERSRTDLLEVGDAAILRDVDRA